MSSLRFDGKGAGLGFASASGDRNSPFDYVLVCKCGVDLGPLGRFLPNADEVRTAECLLCACVTIVKGTQIAGLTTRGAIEAARAARAPVAG